MAAILEPIVSGQDAPPVCLAPWIENPSRLVSLWDIVNTFDVSQFGLLLLHLNSRSVLYQQFSKTDGGRVELGQNKRACKLFSKVQEFGERCGFVQAQEGAILAREHIQLSGLQNVSSLDAEFRHVTFALIRDSRKVLFLKLRADLSVFVDQEMLFGVDVFDKYPSARRDIMDAGNAIAAELGTAAVFHLMRAVEWGLRALCAHVGFRAIKTVKRSGKTKYTPVSYNDWESILRELQTKVDARIDTLKRGPAKQSEQEFFYPLIQDIKGFKDAWRNHVMHTRREYSTDDAIAVFGHVQAFMKKIATRFRE